jgi:hypothetical protein
MVIFIEIKNELVIGFHLVVFSKFSPRWASETGSIYIVRDLNPEVACWHYPLDLGDLI